AGTLNSEHDGETFADHREAILKTAKALGDSDVQYIKPNLFVLFLLPCFIKKGFSFIIA
ncbi:unnamed protein product, partial [Rotaria sordida]